MSYMKKYFKALAWLSAGLLAVSSCDKGEYFSGWRYYASDESYAPDVTAPENPEGGKFDKIVENEFISAAEQPVSTFSVDADGASYTWMRRCIADKMLPSANSVRIEEFINYFPFNYEDPSDGNTVALNAETGTCPWAPGHLLIRLGMQGKRLRDSEIPTANFVFLVDVSGSMDSEDKLDLLKSSLAAMVETLRPQDRVSIVTYAGTVKKLLGSTPASESSKIISAIKKLSASGSTAGGEAMKMAYEEALKNFIEGGNNRVIMGTDGDFNVGVTNTDALKEMVQDYAKKGIYLTVCGFGWGNLNDSMMETVSNAGNGTYEYIANSDDMVKVFIRERGKFRSVANDCKIQVSFNPETVAKYRLIGYENRKMSNDDFENDEKDAAEIGAGQSITALYEIVPAEGAAGGSPAKFAFRYKKDLGSESIPMELDVPAASETVSEDFWFAAAVASYGMILRGSEYRGNADLAKVVAWAEDGSKTFDPFGYRKNFIEIVGKALPLTQKLE